MTLPLPPRVWDVLQKWADEGRSGQVTLEYRNGRIVACQQQHKERLDDGPPVNGALEIKASGPRLS